MQQFVVVLLKMESPQTEWPDQFFHVVPTGAGKCCLSGCLFKTKHCRLQLPFRDLVHVLYTVYIQRLMFIMYNEKKGKCISSHICFLSLYLSSWGDKENKGTCRLCPLITFGVPVCKMLMFSALISTATVDLCILSGCFDVSKRLTCCRSWFSFTGQLFSYAGLPPACTVQCPGTGLLGLRALQSYIHSQTHTLQQPHSGARAAF